MFFVKKIQQIKEQQRVEIANDDGLRQQYDARLLQELQQLRSQNEHEILALRDDLAVQYEKKVRFFFSIFLRFVFRLDRRFTNNESTTIRSNK